MTSFLDISGNLVVVKCFSLGYNFLSINFRATTEFSSLSDLKSTSVNNKPHTIFRTWEVYISVVLLCNPGSLGWFFDAFLSAKLKWMRHIQLRRVLSFVGFHIRYSTVCMCPTFPFTVGVRILWTSLRVGSKREQSQVIYLVYLLYEVLILFKHLSRNVMWKLRVPIQTMLFYSIRTVVSTLNLGHLCSILQNFALIGLLH